MYLLKNVFVADCFEKQQSIVPLQDRYSQTKHIIRIINILIPVQRYNCLIYGHFVSKPLYSNIWRSFSNSNWSCDQL